MTHLCTVGDNCRGHDAAGNQIPPRDVWDGGYLCLVCSTRLNKWIIQLPAIAADLSDSLIPGGHAGTGGKGHESLRWPVNPAVLGLEHHIWGVLSRWAADIVEKRQLAPPAVTLDDSKTIAGWLAPHVRTWVVYQDFAADMYTEIRDLHHQAWNAAYPDRHRRRFPLPRHRRQCPECDGELHAVISGDQHTDTIIQCDSCNVEWGPIQWFRLGRRVLARQHAKQPA